MHPLLEPTVEITLREPRAPSDMKPSVDVKLIDGGVDKHAGNDRINRQLFPERGDVFFLDGIEKKTGITIDKGGTPDPQLKISHFLNFQRQSVLDTLQELHNRLHQIDGYSLFVRDGKIRYALAAFPNNNTGQEILAQYTYDNFLVETTPISEDEGGRRGPLLTEKKDDAAVGYDFEMLGDPRLRPGDTVTFLRERLQALIGVRVQMVDAGQITLLLKGVRVQQPRVRVLDGDRDVRPHSWC